MLQYRKVRNISYNDDINECSIGINNDKKIDFSYFHQNVFGYRNQSTSKFSRKQNPYQSVQNSLANKG